MTVTNINRLKSIGGKIFTCESIYRYIKYKKQKAEVNCQFLQWKETTNEFIKGPELEHILFNILPNKL